MDLVVVASVATVRAEIGNEPQLGSIRFLWLGTSNHGQDCKFTLSERILSVLWTSKQREQKKKMKRRLWLQSGIRAQWRVVFGTNKSIVSQYDICASELAAARRHLSILASFSFFF